ncbi:GtrA family protein [Nonomuraea sp. NPDC049695]|uniref:GtrA family protein n=1 Tax=Nonomuraea sp. NPDC049695 TaxID=3154734 RepID=UPI003443302F
MNPSDCREPDPATAVGAPSNFWHRVAYLTGGGLTAVIYYGFFALGLHLLRDVVPYVCVAVVGHFITVVIVYPWYRLVVFPGADVSWLVGYLRFYAVGLSVLAFSIVGLPILSGLVGIPLLVAQALIICMTLSGSYVVHRMWTFRRRGSRGPGKSPDNLQQSRGVVKSH